VVGLLVLKYRLLADLAVATEPAADLTRRILEYSVPTAATRLSVVLDSRVDKVLLGVLIGPVAVGFYTLAKQIADFCIVPATALGFTISPALGDQHADDATERAATLYERSMENVLLLYLPAAVGLALVAEPAIRILVGTDYLGAVPVLQLFSFFVIVRAIHKITGNGLDYLGLARIRAIARGTAAGSNVVLNLLLIPQFGVMGAAVATVVTYTAYTAVNVYYIHRELNLEMGYLLGRTARIGAIAVAMGGVVWPLIPHVSGVFTLAGAVLVGGAVWAGLAIASGLLDIGEMRGLLA
jgi:O-antigen/teichoic acid export membrane protein